MTAAGRRARRASGLCPGARRFCVSTFFVTPRKWSVTQRSMRSGAPFFARPPPDEQLDVDAARGEQIKIVLNYALLHSFLALSLLHDPVARWGYGA